MRVHRLRFSTVCVVLLFVLAAFGSLRVVEDAAPSASFTVILEGGLLYDGTGAEPYRADVGVRGDRIAQIGDLSDASAERRVDVSGLAVAPGFIDIHSHATGSSFSGSDIVQRPEAESYLRQGVTTALGGQDGSSPLPIGDYLTQLEAAPGAINIGLFVGHGTVRGYVMALADRPPTDVELKRMRAHVRKAMEEGAFGLSSGLEYTPGTYADTEELVALAREIAPFDGLYISHIRNEGGQLLESVEEVIRIAEEAEVAGHVTHHKVVGPDRWGNSAASLRRIEQVRARGLDVTSDVYPYTASSTGLTILFPAWSRGGDRTLRDRLADPAVRPRIHDAIVRHLNEERGGDPATVALAHCPANPDLDGMSLADVLEARGETPSVETAAALAMELYVQGGCRVVLHSMSDEDVRRIMRHPTTMIASDGGIPASGVGAPHPRSYGTFARVLGHYAREEGVLTMHEAVYKMTGLPADRLGLDGRGRLQEGAVADLAVFDPETVIDRATFAAPHQFADGVVHVFVAGEAVLFDGEVTGARPGRVVRGSAWERTVEHGGGR